MVKILSVDDSASMRELIAYTISQTEFEVVSAVDGCDGLEKARQQQFDLVLSDINMPIMDGIAFLKSLRELPEYRFTPVLMLTTETDQETKKAARESGATGWIAKPFDPEKLLSTIQRVLE